MPTPDEYKRALRLALQTAAEIDASAAAECCDRAAFRAVCRVLAWTAGLEPWASEQEVIWRELAECLNAKEEEAMIATPTKPTPGDHVTVLRAARPLHPTFGPRTATAAGRCA